MPGESPRKRATIVISHATIAMFCDFCDPRTRPKKGFGLTLDLNQGNFAEGSVIDAHAVELGISSLTLPHCVPSGSDVQSAHFGICPLLLDRSP